MAAITPQNGRVAFLTDQDPHTYYELQDGTNGGINYGSAGTGDNVDVSGQIGTSDSYSGLNAAETDFSGHDFDDYIVTDAAMLLYLPAGMTHSQSYGIFHNGGGTHAQGIFVRATTTGVEICATHNASGTPQDNVIYEIPDADLPGWFCVSAQYASSGGNQGDMALWVNGVKVRSGTRNYQLAYGSGNPQLGDSNADDPLESACLDPSDYAGGNWGSESTINGSGILIANFTVDNPANDNTSPAGAGDQFHEDYYDAHVDSGGAPGDITYVGVGGGNAADTAFNVDLPTGIQEGDLMLLGIEGLGEDGDADGGPTGWTLVASVASDTDGTADRTRCTVYYRVATSSETDPVTVPDAGDHGIANIIAFRGVDTSTPFDATAVTSSDNSNDTSLTATGITTSTDGAMVVCIASCGDNSTTMYSSWANSDLASISDARLWSSGEGADGTNWAAWGIDTTAGTVGNFTATLETSEEDAAVVMALKPAVTGLETLSLSGAMTPAGVTSRSAASSVDGSVTPAGSPQHLTTTSPSGSIALAGSPRASVLRLLLGVLSSISATVTKHGAIARLGEVEPVGDTQRLVTLLPSGEATPSGTIQRLTNSWLTGAISSTGTVATQLVGGLAQLVLEAALSVSGTASKLASHLSEASTTPTGIVSKSTSAVLTGAISTAGTLRRAIGSSLVAALTTAGALLRRGSMTFAGNAVASTGTLSIDALKLFSGAIDTSGVVVPVGTGPATTGTVILEYADGSGPLDSMDNVVWYLAWGAEAEAPNTVLYVTLKEGTTTIYSMTDGNPPAWPNIGYVSFDLGVLGATQITDWSDLTLEAYAVSDPAEGVAVRIYDTALFYPEGGNLAVLQLSGAIGFRSGSQSGAAWPNDWNWGIVGTTGAWPTWDDAWFGGELRESKLRKKVSTSLPSVLAPAGNLFDQIGAEVLAGIVTFTSTVIGRLRKRRIPAGDALPIEGDEVRVNQGSRARPSRGRWRVRPQRSGGSTAEPD